MFHKPVSGLVGIALFLAAAAAPAQDFRVYTKIFDARPVAPDQKPARPPLVGRSTSLFHAGKVYDCLDSGNRMTIFEPAHERFVVIDEPRRAMTVISFEHLENRLFQAVKNAEKYIARLRTQNDRKSNDLAEQLQFQLTPAFETTDDERTKILKLQAPVLAYDVKYDVHDSAELIEIYLNYADWAARLNYLVNDMAMLPGPRLALDDVLRRRQVLPVEVTLQTTHQSGRHLRAEHRFDWGLDRTDLKKIAHWEKLFSSGQLKEVSPAKFFEPAAAEKAGPVKQAAHRAVTKKTAPQNLGERGDRIGPP